MPARTERLQFPGASGARLAARLERPLGPTAAYALFAHCFTCSKDLKAAVRVSRTLAERGIAVLRFDFTGLGESEGDFADTDFSSNLEDLVAAAEFLKREFDPPRLLVGHSLGGAAVLAAASRIPEAEAVATIGAPSDTRHLHGTLSEKAPGLDAAGETAEVTLAGRKIRIGRGLLEDLAETRLEESIRSLRRPLLLFHSPVDDVVGIEHAQKIYLAAKHPKSFVSLDDADHLLTRAEDAAYVAEVLAAWAARYVSRPEPTRENEVVVSGGPTGYASAVRVGRHVLAADEPVSVGGEDSGPSPYEFLLAGLGACKAMTMRMYADRKGWPLEGTQVRLRHSKMHAQDCADCETKEGKLDRIEVEIALEGPLDAEQRKRVLEIADRCPVHRTLSSEIVIASRAGEA